MKTVFFAAMAISMFAAVLALPGIQAIGFLVASTFLCLKISSA